MRKFEVNKAIYDVLGNFCMHNIQKIALSNSTLNSHTQFENIQNVSMQSLAGPFLKIALYFFFTAKANVHVNCFIALFIIVNYWHGIEY